MSEISQILRNEIYPIIDAADAGLLDSLNPTQSSDYYKVNCPQCGKREAFYKPGYANVSCSRKKECGRGTSIFEVVKSANGISNRDTYLKIFAIAGEDLPEDPNYKKVGSPIREAEKVYKSVLKNFLLESEKAMHYMKSIRGWTEEEIQQSELGYLPTFRELREKLIELGEGKHLKTLSEYDLLKEDKESKGSFEGRIIGFWPQSEMFSLWGRSIDNEDPKYKYQTNKPREIPYLADKTQLNKNKATSLVEGVLDAQRLRVNNFDAWGLGSNAPSNKQLQYIANKSNRSLMHWIDNDVAGVKGGLRSILELNKFNIRIGICSTKEGKDADELISEQGRAGVSTSNIIFQKDYEFLSQQITNAIANKGKIPTWVNNLNQALWFDLHCHCKTLGIEIKNNLADALRASASLVESGITHEEVSRIIKNRYQIDISMKTI